MHTWTDPQTTGLLYPQLCDDLSYLYEALQSALGLTPVSPSTYIPQFGTSADGSSLTVTVNGRLVATVPIPVGGTFGGPYVTGVGYGIGTLVTSGGSAYVVTQAFTARTLTQDLASGFLKLFASAGAPAVNRRGPYVATQAYAVGDGVTTTASAATANGQTTTTITQWVLSAAAPAGTAPAAGSSYWSLVAGPSLIDSGYVNDATYGNLATALQTLTTNVAAALAAGVLAQKQVAALNAALGQAGIQGNGKTFPIVLPTS